MACDAASPTTRKRMNSKLETSARERIPATRNISTREQKMAAARRTESIRTSFQRPWRPESGIDKLGEGERLPAIEAGLSPQRPHLLRVEVERDQAFPARIAHAHHERVPIRPGLHAL